MRKASSGALPSIHSFFSILMIMLADNECLDHITKTRLFKYIENFTLKTELFQIRNSDIFLVSAQKQGSNEYPQSIFLSRNKKIMYTPVNPSFTIMRIESFRSNSCWQLIYESIYEAHVFRGVFYFCGVYCCINASESFTNWIKSGEVLHVDKILKSSKIRFLYNFN